MKDNQAFISCLKFECSEDGRRVTVYIGSESTICIENGKTMNLSTGQSINCPNDLDLFCASYQECPDNCN